MRIALGVLLGLHGLIHLAGFAKAFALVDLATLTQPISRPVGLLWLFAGAAMITTALLPWRLLWIVGLLALTTSQVAIVTSWADARFGTLPNVVLLLAVVYGFAARGPLSLPAGYAADTTRILHGARPGPVVTEADLTPLPAPVQRYLRTSGAVGQPRPGSVRVRWRGRIRAGAADPWMPLTAEQVNIYGPSPSRLFLLAATMKGVPVAVYHRFIGAAATFRVRLLSLLPIIDARGPEMNRAETVTLFNDLCVLAPGRLVDPAIRWEPIDDTHARATFTRGDQTISAELRFDPSGMLVDFVSDDRARASADGATFTPARWSTPLAAPRGYGRYQLASRGEARWHEPGDPGPGYAYIELELLAYQVEPAATSAR